MLLGARAGKRRAMKPTRGLRKIGGPLFRSSASRHHEQFFARPVARGRPRHGEAGTPSGAGAGTASAQAAALARAPADTRARTIAGTRTGAGTWTIAESWTG